ncbi:unnamed protein product [Chondrus crispus]|uniref:Uncharacterized protein n=1 Tax=Chondrus crispus TaxID=2769 RepID=S0F3V9_CHOCR|nr:unnamed protein product [Chondrus crispus]CDF77513.1 unnamed protein product [Chondrus crispus]|eukprot:XP_005712713.1 unnamed protein product [Chondrus crispus]
MPIWNSCTGTTQTTTTGWTTFRRERSTSRAIDRLLHHHWSELIICMDSFIHAHCFSTIDWMRTSRKLVTLIPLPPVLSRSPHPPLPNDYFQYLAITPLCFLILFCLCKVHSTHVRFSIPVNRDQLFSAFAVTVPLD